MRMLTCALLLLVLAVLYRPLSGEEDLVLEPGTETVTDGALPPIEKMPEITHFVEADYPRELSRKGVEGTVVLTLIISDSGKVDSAAVAKGVHPVLDSSAVAAARGFRFSPARAQGQAIAVMIQYEYKFSLDDALKSRGEYVNFTGTLLEKGTRKPVAEAMVVIDFIDPLSDTTLPVPFSAYCRMLGQKEGQFLEENQLAALTDSQGVFKFRNLPACSIGIKCPIPGYELLSEKEVIRAGEATEAHYYIRKISYSEYEVVGFGRQEKKEVSRRQLTLGEVKKVPGLGGDAIRVVQALPGVSRPSFGSGEVIVRGSGNEDSRYFLDGVEIPAIFHVGQLRSTYNSDLLSSIDMYPGGFNSRYGGAVGGVVEINGRPAKTDRWHGNLDVSFMDASLLAEGPLNRTLSLAVSGRKSYIGKFLETATEDAPLSVIPVYWDIVSRLDYRPGTNDRMFLTYFASGDRLEVFTEQVRGGSDEISDAPNSVTTDDKNHSLIYGYDRFFSKRVQNELRTSLRWSRSTGNFFNFSKWKFETYSLYLRDQLTWSPKASLKINSGLDADIDTLEYKGTVLSTVGPQTTQAARLYTNLGLYTNTEISPTKNLLIVPGLRYDYFRELDEGELSFRLTSRYQYREGHTLKGALGTYNQTPKPWGQAVDSVWGNPELPMTKAAHFVAGYEWQMTDLLRLDGQAYYNRQWDVPRFANDINPKTGRPYNFLADMEGRMYGLELLLRHDLGNRFFGWLSYSVSRSERRAPGPILQGPNRYTDWDPERWVLFGKDQTHNLQLVGSWRLPRNWEAGFRLRYVTGNPATPLLSYTEDKYEYDSDFGNYVKLEGETNSDRMDPFVQLDARVDKKFVFKKWLLSAYLDVQNLNYFFYNSPEFYNYNYDASEREAVGFFILPSLGVRAEF